MKPGSWCGDEADGARHLRELGLSFDCFLLGPQLSELIDLAAAFSDTCIVLNHVGEPLQVGGTPLPLPSRADAMICTRWLDTKTWW